MKTHSFWFLLFLFQFVSLPSVAEGRDTSLTGSIGQDSTEVFAFEIVEEIPRFRGGEYDLKQFFSQKLIYPYDARCEGIEGVVAVSFYVDEKGVVSQIETHSNLPLSFEREVKRVVKAMPRWTPGKTNSRKSRIKFILPIQFSLSSYS